MIQPSYLYWSWLKNPVFMKLFNPPSPPYQGGMNQKSLFLTRFYPSPPYQGGMPTNPVVIKCKQISKLSNSPYQGGVACSSYQEGRVEKPRKNRVASGQKGLSLFEVLIAITVFSFMFVVIAQIVQQNYRQGQKMQNDIRTNSAFDNSKELIKKDLSSVAFFLDINRNLNFYFPLTDKEIFSNPAERRQEQSLSVLYDKAFFFKGTSSELEFVSYASSEGVKDKQWLHLRYYIDSCPELENSNKGQCLIRSSRGFWGESNTEPVTNELVVLRGFESLEWAYSNDYKLKKEWKEEWKYPAGQSRSRLNSSLSFPTYVQMKLKRENQKERIETFPVAQDPLMAWSPHAKKWNRWPKLEVKDPKKTTEPKKDPVKKSEASK